MRNDTRPLDLAAAYAVAAAAIAVMLLLGLLVRRVEPDPVSTPLIDSDGRLYYLIALASAGGVAAIAVVRGSGLAPRRKDRRDWRVGVAPGIAAFAGSLLLVWHHDWRATLLISLALGGFCLLHLALPSLLVAPQQRATAQAVIAVGVLYVLLAMILSFRTRTLYGGTVSGAAVALVILAGLSIDLEYWRVVRAAAVGLVAAEVVWALNYLDLSHWASAIPVTAAALIGGWLIQRDEAAALGGHVAASGSGDDPASIARQRP